MTPDIALPGLSGDTLSGWLAAVGALAVLGTDRVAVGEGTDGQESVLAAPDAGPWRLRWNDDDTALLTPPHTVTVINVLRAFDAHARATAATPWQRRSTGPESMQGYTRLADSNSMNWGAWAEQSPWSVAETSYTPREGDHGRLRPARWARNAAPKSKYDVHKALADNADILTDDNGWKNAAPATRWADVLGTRPALERDKALWATHGYHRNLPDTGSTTGFVSDAVVPSVDGIREETGSWGGNPSTKLRVLHTPGTTYLAIVGLTALPTHGAHLPGARTADDPNVVRWPLWSQPLTLNAVNDLLWHPALDSPNDPQTRLLCGDRPDPVRATRLVQTAGTIPTTPPVRTRR